MRFARDPSFTAVLQLRKPIHADAPQTNPPVWQVLSAVCQHPDKMRQLWEPVQRLHGVGNVVLSGCITEALAEDITAKMTALTSQALVLLRRADGMRIEGGYFEKDFLEAVLASSVLTGECLDQ